MQEAAISLAKMQDPYTRSLQTCKIVLPGNLQASILHEISLALGLWMGKIVADMKDKSNAAGNKTREDMKLFLYSAVRESGNGFF